MASASSEPQPGPPQEAARKGGAPLLSAAEAEVSTPSTCADEESVVEAEEAAKPKAPLPALELENAMTPVVVGRFHFILSRLPSRCAQHLDRVLDVLSRVIVGAHLFILIYGPYRWAFMLLDPVTSLDHVLPFLQFPSWVLLVYQTQKHWRAKTYFPLIQADRWYRFRQGEEPPDDFYNPPVVRFTTFLSVVTMCEYLPLMAVVYFARFLRVTTKETDTASTAQWPWWDLILYYAMLIFLVIKIRQVVLGFLMFICVFPMFAIMILQHYNYTIMGFDIHTRAECCLGLANVNTVYNVVAWFYKRI